jgi:hypothetical protein
VYGGALPGADAERYFRQMPEGMQHVETEAVQLRQAVSEAFPTSVANRYRQGFLKAALAGWQLNGLWAFQSGAHWTPYDPRRAQHFNELAPGACKAGTFAATKCENIGGDYNLDGVANDRPNAVANHISATQQQWADGFNLPANFFTPPCLACIGNLGRNMFLGPGYWSADVSVFKKFFPRRCNSNFAPKPSMF